MTTQPGSPSTCAARIAHRPASAAISAAAGSRAGEMCSSSAPGSSVAADATVPGANGAKPQPQPLAISRDGVTGFAGRRPHPFYLIDEARNAASTSGSVSVGAWPMPGSVASSHVGPRRLHARHGRGQQDVARFAMDQQQGQMRQPAEQRPQIGRPAVHQPRDARVPHRSQHAIAVGRIGERRHRPPCLVAIQRQRRQHRAQMRDRRVDVGECGVMADEAADEVGAARCRSPGRYHSARRHGTATDAPPRDPC